MVWKRSGHSLTSKGNAIIVLLKKQCPGRSPTFLGSTIPHSLCTEYSTYFTFLLVTVIGKFHYYSYFGQNIPELMQLRDLTKTEFSRINYMPSKDTFLNTVLGSFLAGVDIRKVVKSILNRMFQFRIFLCIPQFYRWT